MYPGACNLPAVFRTSASGRTQHARRLFRCEPIGASALPGSAGTSKFVIDGCSQRIEVIWPFMASPIDEKRGLSIHAAAYAAPEVFAHNRRNLPHPKRLYQVRRW